jgi:hypothetical protein
MQNLSDLDFVFDLSALIVQMIMVSIGVFFYGECSFKFKKIWVWFLIASILILARRAFSMIVNSSDIAMMVVNILLNFISVAFLLFVLKMRSNFKFEDEE